MRKKIVAGLLAIALAGVGVLSANTTVMAGANYDDVGFIDRNNLEQGATQDGLKDNPESNVKSIGVNASTTGGGDIRYSVVLTWGIMEFVYDYGSTWNPQTHEYQPEPNSQGDLEGGWVQTYVDGSNNIIHVENNSNFPIEVSFTYEGKEDTLNTEETLNPVKGIFSATNATLKDALDGKLAEPTIASMTEAKMYLSMINTGLKTGMKYYEFKSGHQNENDDMFFTLIGKPTRKLSMSNTQPVGEIKVKIAPGTSIEEVTKTSP